MNVTVLDLRRRMSDVIHALNKKETVTIYYRGRKKGVIYPVGGNDESGPVRDHPAFGLWKDRDDMKRVDKAVREMRRGRPHAV